MIIESVLFALTLPATPAGFRAHISPALGLWARGKRQARAWQPHLAATRRFIADATATARGGTLAVLGSGPLFDIPLDILAHRFARVLLIDRAHLFPAQRRAARHSNVELVWRDLAGPLDFLSDIPGLSHVVSANLLSQLAHGAPTGRERGIVEAHLHSLAALACPATLVTDFAYEIRDRAGRLHERFDLLYGMHLPKGEAGWRWDVAPLGEESLFRHRTHDVAAFADWRRSAAPGFQKHGVLLLPQLSTP